MLYICVLTHLASTAYIRPDTTSSYQLVIGYFTGYFNLYTRFTLCNLIDSSFTPFSSSIKIFVDRLGFYSGPWIFAPFGIQFRV